MLLGNSSLSSVMGRVRQARCLTIKIQHRHCKVVGNLGRHGNTVGRKAQRRNFSADKGKDKVKENEVSLEQCAQSLSHLTNQQLAAAPSLEPAMELAQKLSPSARQEIVKILEANKRKSQIKTSQVEVPEPSYNDLKLVALAQAIPFVGFGFLDNAILIVAGDAIDTSLGVVLGISTLCAAAIGNIISDVAGVVLGTVIEDFCTNYLKLPMPNLSNAQRQLRSVRFASQFGCAGGIVIGCIIGMFPLLFIDSKKIQALKRDAALKDIFQDVMSEAKNLIGAESTSLFIVVDRDPKEGSPIPNPDGQFLYAKYFYSDSGEVSHRTFKVGRGIVSRTALTGQAWNIRDVEAEPDYRPDMHGQKHKVKNMACVPVLDSNGKTIAVIRAFNKIGHGSVGHDKETATKSNNLSPKEMQRRGFTNHDVQVLKALASHISVSLQYMYQENQEEAAMGVKDTIRILKEHGLAGIPEEQKTPVFKRRPPLFPED